MWHPLWPERPSTSVPIGSRHERRPPRPGSPGASSTTAASAPRRTRATIRLSGARTILDDAALWRVARRGARRRSCDFMRGAAGELPGSLDPDALTIGFARRFATYKRADLIFRDPDSPRPAPRRHRAPGADRLAGKAHPADDGGKELIQKVSQFARTRTRTAASFPRRTTTWRSPATSSRASTSG